VNSFLDHEEVLACPVSEDPSGSWSEDPAYVQDRDHVHSVSLDGSRIDLVHVECLSEILEIVGFEDENRVLATYVRDLRNNLEVHLVIHVHGDFALVCCPGMLPLSSWLFQDETRPRNHGREGMPSSKSVRYRDWTWKCRVDEHREQVFV
jgi:hypothetical protein